MSLHHQPPSQKEPPDKTDQLLAEIREVRSEQTRLRRLFDEFAGTYLNSKFPYGRPTDRWGRRA